MEIEGDNRLESDGTPRTRHKWIVIGLLFAIVAGGIALFVFPAGSDLEREIDRLLAIARRDERNSQGIYKWIATMEDWPDPMPRVAAWLLEGDPTIDAWEAAELLSGLDEQAGPILVERYHATTSPAIRSTIIDALEGYPKVDSFSIVTNALLSDASEDVRQAAAYAVWNFEPERIEPALLASLQTESQEFILNTVIQRLGANQSAAAFDPILHHTRSNSTDRTTGIAALGNIGGPRAVPVLREFLDSTDPDDQVPAAMTLARLNDTNSIPKIEGYMKSTVEKYVDARKAETAGQYQSARFGSFTAYYKAMVMLGSDATTPDLIRALQATTENYAKRNMIRLLASSRSDEAVAALTPYLKDQADVAAAAAEALGNIGTKEAVAALLKIYEGDNQRLRQLVAIGLATAGNTNTLPVLLDMVANPSGDDQQTGAVKALGLLGDPAAIPVLSAILPDQDSYRQEETIWALGHIGSREAVPALLTVTTNKDFRVRFSVAFALANIGDTNVVPDLKPWLSDRERRLRLAAACSLAFHDSDAGLQELIRESQHKEDWQEFAALVGLIRLNNADARAHLEGLTSTRFQPLIDIGLARGGTAALLHYLREDNEEYRRYAARMLPFFRDPSAIDQLKEASHDPNVEVRSAARVAAVRLERLEAAQRN